MFCIREFKDQISIVIGHYESEDYENFMSYDFCEDEMPNITHWMPLPERPKTK